jgi:O-antigen ligase
MGARRQFKGRGPMTTASISVPLDREVATPSHAVRLLQVFVITLMLLPADYVIKAIGAGGYAAALVSYVLLMLWLAATLFGEHNPFACRYPVRIALAMLWVVSLLSYLMMNRGLMSSTQLASADRWLMQLAGISGVVLVAAECLNSLEDVRRVLRTLTWAGAICGIVAALQFKAGTDLTRYLKLPGFALNAAVAINTGIGVRGGESRVPGTATDPIELGVVAGMLLPLAAYLLMHDTERPKWRRWVPFLCIALAVPASVSRSGVLAVVVSLGVLVVSLPPTRRLKGMAAIPPALAAVFVTAHGLIGTLTSYFLAGTADSSVAHRTNNYPYVEQLVQQAPWLGQGGGTYIPHSAVNILDNEYLTTAIQLGLLGLFALAFFLIWPAVAALVARKNSTDPKLRDLCAALAGAEFAAVVCSATFDSLSFPMFVNVQALVAGLCGAVWMLAGRRIALPFISMEDLSDGLVLDRRAHLATQGRYGPGDPAYFYWAVLRTRGQASYLSVNRRGVAG